MNAWVRPSQRLQLWQKHLKKPLFVKTTSPPVPTGPGRWHRASFPDFSRAEGQGSYSGRWAPSWCQMPPSGALQGPHPSPRWRCRYPRFTDEALELKEVAGLVWTAQLKALKLLSQKGPQSRSSRRWCQPVRSRGTPELRGIPQWPASLPEGPPASSFPLSLLQRARVRNRPLTSSGSWAPLMLSQRKAKTNLALQSSVGSETP